MRGAAWALAAVAALGAASGARAADDVVVDGEEGAALDATVTRAGGADFWGSVLVSRGGKVLLAKGYGAADYEKTPNTPATLFEIASASKQVTATAILRLEQDGKLALADPISRHLADVPEDKRAITVHHLLTHTSGISGDAGVPYASTIARREYVRTVLRDPLVTPPGERFAYCNAGYALLAAIVEEVTSKDFEAYVESALFKPAGLASTGFIGDRDLVKSPKAAVRRNGEPGRRTASDWHRGWGYRGMGGVVTTVWDLHRWDRALRGDKILKAEARRKLVTPALGGYACGWLVRTTDRGTTVAHHSGSVGGFGADVVRFLEDDAAVFVLSNDPRKAVEASTALQAALFPPVEWKGTADPGTATLNEHASATLAAPAWDVTAADGRLRLRLLDGAHVAAEITAPVGAAKGLAAAVDAALAGRPDDGAPPAMDAALYLLGYPAEPARRALGPPLAVRVDPEYRGTGADGKPVVDPRPVLVVEDRRVGQWPVMVKMNVAAARALAAALRRAAE